MPDSGDTSPLGLARDDRLTADEKRRILRQLTGYEGTNKYEHIRSSAVMRKIGEEVGFEFDTADWRSPRPFRNAELEQIHEELREVLDDAE